MEVEPDGSVVVTENLTYSFDGSFSGAYREIPLRAGESITDVTVSEAGEPYGHGGCTDLGCSSAPSTFGVADLGGRVRVVWHYRSFGETRTFTLRYTMLGLAKAADDVVDVYLQVWGDEWKEPLDQLTASMTLPGPAVPGDALVWGHPASVAGSTSLGSDQARPTLEASNIPPGQFVEMRVVFPRTLLTSTTGAAVIQGDRLEDIRNEELELVEADQRRAGLVRALAIGLLALIFLPGLIGVIYIYFRYGREPAITYDREYEQEPPSDLPPAEVGALMSQGSVDERQFTATLFELIRRGVIGARPVTVERETWMGLRSEDISDLELSLTGKEEGLTVYEAEVLGVVDRVLDDEPRPLHEFRKLIKEDAAANAAAYKSFRSKAVEALEKRKLLDRRGGVRLAATGGALVVLAFIAFFFTANFATGSATTFVAPMVILAVLFNALILGVFAASRRG
ncbi:MAG: DUF2207 domain-containing protein, partial [Acidimicrobiia bacterium]